MNKEVIQGNVATDYNVATDLHVLNNNNNNNNNNISIVLVV